MECDPEQKQAQSQSVVPISANHTFNSLRYFLVLALAPLLLLQRPDIGNHFLDLGVSQLGANRCRHLALAILH